MSKQRLDILLVSRNLVESRELAQRLIIAGEVSVGGHPSTKPGLKVNEDADITIRNRPRYVSRGGLKMEGALNAFPVSAEGKVCLDIGASTGGFTDCLLQHGAARVHAIDVGTNQLVWKLRQDPRVIVKEKIQRPLHDSGGYWGTSGSDRFRRLLYLSEKNPSRRLSSA